MFTFPVFILQGHEEGFLNDIFRRKFISNNRAYEIEQPTLILKKNLGINRGGYHGDFRWRCSGCF